MTSFGKVKSIDLIIAVSKPEYRGSRRKVRVTAMTTASAYSSSHHRQLPDRLRSAVTGNCISETRSWCSPVSIHAAPGRAPITGSSIAGPCVSTTGMLATKPVRRPAQTQPDSSPSERRTLGPRSSRDNVLTSCLRRSARRLRPAEAGRRLRSRRSASRSPASAAGPVHPCPAGWCANRQRGFRAPASV